MDYLTGGKANLEEKEAFQQKAKLFDKKAHDKIRKKTVFEKFKVIPCPQYKEYGG